jgi:hypothetical protein
MKSEMERALRTHHRDDLQHCIHMCLNVIKEDCLSRIRLSHHALTVSDKPRVSAHHMELALDSLEEAVDKLNGMLNQVRSDRSKA